MDVALWPNFSLDHAKESLTPKRPKSMQGNIGSLGMFPWYQFSLWFFETFFGLVGMYYFCRDIVFFARYLEK
jgi:hypothetical protein